MIDYTYSRTIVGEDGSTMTFGISGCHSYDEAIKFVEKGIYDYELKCEAEEKEKAEANKSKEASKVEAEAQTAKPDNNPRLKK